MALLFVPVSAAGLADWARTGVLAGRHAAFTAGRGLLEAFGLRALLGVSDPECAIAFDLHALLLWHTRIGALPTLSACSH